MSAKSTVMLKPFFWQIQSEEELMTCQTVYFVLIWIQVCVQYFSLALGTKCLKNTYLTWARTWADSSRCFIGLWQSGSISDCEQWTLTHKHTMRFLFTFTCFTLCHFYIMSIIPLSFAVFSGTRLQIWYHHLCFYKHSTVSIYWNTAQILPCCVHKANKGLW